MRLSSTIHQFFNKYLPHIKALSPHTVKSYRDTFKLFLPYAANYHGIKISSLQMAHLSVEVILDFLDNLEKQRQNSAKTRNSRLAALKSLAKMIRFMHPEQRQLADKICSIPQKRCQRQLIGFLYPHEIDLILQAVDLKNALGVRDYCLLQLLYDSGARATEIATLNLDYFNAHNKTLAILGKGNRYRQIELEAKTVRLLNLYIARYRVTPKPAYQHRLFINQHGRQLTRHGIYRLCKKYLHRALPPKRLKDVNPVHSFRHSCAIKMLTDGHSVSDIRNKLGHEDIQSTMVYLQLDLAKRKKIQQQFIQYVQSNVSQNPEIDELIDWQNKDDIMAWLDDL
jgi:site-specific recombinase XerD